MFQSSHPSPSLRVIPSRPVVAALLALALALTGCPSEDEQGSSRGDPDGTVLRPEWVNDATDSAEQVAERETVSVIVAEQARIGYVPPSTVGGRNLNDRVIGEELSLTFDIDADGTAEDLWAFEVSAEPITFFAWQSGEVCNLAWNEATTSWYLFALCGGTSGEMIVCGRAAGAAESTCSECDGQGSCDACSTEDDGIYCEEPQPPIEPDTDAGEDPSTDPFTDPVIDPVTDPVTDPTTDPTADPTVDPVTEPDMGPNVVGECTSACMSQSGAVCCEGCSCPYDVYCTPYCDSPFIWDCEIQCCFNYETFVCDCPQGSVWDGEQYCCAVEGECL